MFGYKSKKVDKPSWTAPSSGILPNEHSAAMDFESEDMDMVFDENELNDPELLRELATLSGGNMPKTKPTAKVTRNSATGHLSINEIATSIPQSDGDIDVEFHENDLENPELLHELEQLGVYEDFQSTVIERSAAVLNNDDRPDPGDQNELNELLDDMKVNKSGEQGSMNSSTGVVKPRLTLGSEIMKQNDDRGKSVAHISTEPAVSCDSVREELKLAFNSSSVALAQLSLEEKLKGNSADLARFIDEEKTNALEKRKMGDKASALESMKAIKFLQQRLSNFSGSQEFDSETVDNTRGASATNTSQIDTQASYTLTLLKKRQYEYKQAALAAKKAGDMGRARELIIVSKTMDNSISSLALVGVIATDFQMPPPPSQLPIKSVTTSAEKRRRSNTDPPSPARDSSTRTKNIHGQSVAVLISQRSLGAAETLDFREITTPDQELILGALTGSFAHIEKSLSEQLQTCTSLAAYHYKMNQKDRALEFHKVKKQFLIDLEALKILDQNTSEPPRIHFKEIRYEILREFTDLLMDEMSVEVVRAFDLNCNPTDDTFVSADIGWPVDIGKENLGRFSTGNVKGRDPEYNFMKTVKVSRTKGFQRWAERRKVSFEIFQYGGWFSKSKSLGKAVTNAQDLINMCEVSQIVDLVDAANPKRRVGGKLELRLRLQNPILGQECLSKSEKWLFVGDKPEASLPLMETTFSPSIGASEKDETPAVTSARVPNSQPINKASEKKPEPGLALPLRTITRTTGKPTMSPFLSPMSENSIMDADTEGRLVELISQFDTVDDLVSNEVLELEKQVVDLQIAQLKIEGENPPPELEFRAQGIAMKLDLLVMMVQTGQLTVEGYAEKLKAEIPKAKRFALEFSRLGRKDYAIKAIQRIKTMEKEVREISGEE